MKVLDGKKLSEDILSEIFESSKCYNFYNSDREDMAIVPKAVFIQLGDDMASNTYITNKVIAMCKCGFEYHIHKLGIDTSEEELCELIYKLNADRTVHGIMVQLPLPNHINTTRIKESIFIEKDIDGFNPINLGLACMGVTEDVYLPATPAGIMEMIDRYELDLDGKHVVVLGRSETVGRPIANILSNKQYNATVTLCHSHTKDVSRYTKMADLIICAIGKANYLTAGMVTEGVTIIDVGINRGQDGKLCGDCDKSVHSVAEYVSPVPGGVGPMTVAMLMNNILKAHTNSLL